MICLLRLEDFACHEIYKGGNASIGQLQSLSSIPQALGPCGVHSLSRWDGPRLTKVRYTCTGSMIDHGLELA